MINRSLGVHDGTFHADEVTACAFLILFNLIDEAKIVRTRDPRQLDECEYVCDVGGVYDPQKKLFDHHQADYRGELSSAGMVLLYLKDQKILLDEEYDFFNHMLIMGIDAHDNGRSPQLLGYCTFSHIIANYNPIAYEATPTEQNHAFFQALHFATHYLNCLWERYKYNTSCREEVAEAMKKYRTCLYFDRALPWFENFFALGGREHSALFIIMPSGTQWKLRGIPPNEVRRMEVRLPLPEEWAGKLEEDLIGVTGMQGAVFCHKGRFTSVWATREDAVAALKIVLEKNGIKNEDLV